MDQKGLRIGHIVALAGALGVLLALWRPWYSVTFPPQIREAFGTSGQLGQDPGLLGQMARSLAAALPASIEASGWKELQGADVALCVAAVAVCVLVLVAADAFGAAVRIDPHACGSAIAALGAATLAIVGLHVVHKPGGAAAADYVHVEQGVWIALAGAGAMLAGGLMAAARPQDGTERASASSGFARLDPELPPVFAPAPGTPGHGSVPPPGA
ncbi:hypothetical protein DSM104299_05592 [Baekduia alba]|uniref:hypothetical protein n=1 Tax=Baekduia alba TaxID=2997333 RepID=UPI00233FE2E9|nr:hypothetical protein [Baekduia alba]WCB96824.1 hypothetical protein DSM104299_05592 [Baekduia alba]